MFSCYGFNSIGPVERVSAKRVACGNFSNFFYFATAEPLRLYGKFNILSRKVYGKTVSLFPFATEAKNTSRAFP